jgi:hypothetical protein
MHNLLRELGRKVAQENISKESRKWSRVWLNEQFYNVMSENMVKFLFENRKTYLYYVYQKLFKLFYLFAIF